MIQNAAAGSSYMSAVNVNIHLSANRIGNGVHVYPCSKLNLHAISAIEHSRVVRVYRSQLMDLGSVSVCIMYVLDYPFECIRISGQTASVRKSAKQGEHRVFSGSRVLIPVAHIHIEADRVAFNIIKHRLIVIDKRSAFNVPHASSADSLISIVLA